MLHNNKIQIAMLEVSEKNQAVLEFYFESVGEDFYTLVSKEQADAFISDYDYPDAKADIEQTLETHHKPIVIISTEEQNIPLTIWLKQPLSAAALTVTSDKIKQMISVFAEQAAENNNKFAEVLEVEDSPIQQLSLEELDLEEASEEIIESQNTKPDNLKQKNKQENKQKESIKQKPIESIKESEAEDFFVFLDENSESTEDDVFKSTTVSTEHLSCIIDSLHTTSKSAVNSEKTNIEENSIFDLLSSEEPSEADKALIFRESSAKKESITKEEPSAKEESSTKKEPLDKKEFSNEEKPLIFEEALSTDSSDQAENLEEIDNHSNLEFSDVDIDVQSSDESQTKEVLSEVDALLESLISEGDDIKQEFEEGSNIEADEAISLENLDIDLDVDEELKEKLVNKEVIIEPDIAEEKDIADLAGFSDEELISKLVEDDESGDVNENKDLVIEESFTIHNDLNPSKEDIFTGTLQVDYADVKTNNKQSDSSLTEDKLIEIEDLSEVTTDKTEDLTQEEMDINAVTPEKLEDDLFDFTLESNANDTSENTETIPSLDVIEPVGKHILNQISDTESTEIESSDLNLEEVVDLAIENDLDRLLKEAEIEENLENDFLDAAKDSIEEELGIADTSSIDDDFTDPVENSLDDNDSPDFELQLLLDEVRQEAGKGNSDNGFGANEKYSETSAYKKTEAEKRWTQLCGDKPSISQQKEVDKISYTYQNYLLNAVLEQLESTKDSENLFRMKYKDLIIVIDHSKNKIYCNIHITNDDYAAVCFSEIDPDDIKIHDLDYSEIRLYRKKIKENTNRAHSIESFIWTTSLLTSQGRLPKGTEIKKTISLKVWPDLTRVEFIPHALNIAAVLSKQPGSLLEISQWLNIPQSYVFAFYNAALALDMIEFDSNKHKKSSGAVKEQGVFGRFFKRSKQ